MVRAGNWAFLIAEPLPRSTFMSAESSKPDRIRGTSQALWQAARSLRLNMTPAEEKLWSALQNKQVLGMRFRRQHAVGRYVLDFYCPACKLAIELDGSVHDDRQEEDAIRTQEIERYGYQVIRFDNAEVMKNLEQVVQQIAEVLQTRSPHKKH
jgi:very-short-patch-repair endonuclease